MTKGRCHQASALHRIPLARSSANRQRRNCGDLGQLVAQGERMLHAVPHGGAAVAPEVLEVSSRGAGNNGVGLLRLPAFEYAGALEHEGAALAADSSHDSL